ncbi:DUF1440 domain-containing protein [Kineococcus gynurae]|uniref:DUF1440 domain-containing protein n=1 Tax=Kineococcus gynurae TaxID=452979 RepID=A0ABV5LU20_9ACTN
MIDVATGLLAGWVGLQAKAKAESALQTWGERVLPPEPGQKELLGADPAGHGERMPPSILWKRVVELTGRNPEAMTPEQVEAGAVWFHRALGYGYPVVYSLVSRRIPAARLFSGALGGTALFTAFHATTLPAMGVQAPVRDLPQAWWVWEGGSHIVFGVAVDAVIGAVRTITR